MHWSSRAQSQFEKGNNRWYKSINHLPICLYIKYVVIGISTFLIHILFCLPYEAKDFLFICASISKPDLLPHWLSPYLTLIHAGYTNYTNYVCMLMGLFYHYQNWQNSVKFFLFKDFIFVSSNVLHMETKELSCNRRPVCPKT